MTEDYTTLTEELPNDADRALEELGERVYEHTDGKVCQADVLEALADRLGTDMDDAETIRAAFRDDPEAVKAAVSDATAGC